MDYVNEFLNLKCAGDTINIIPKQKNYKKEISESMGIIKQFKGITIQNPMQYTLIDLCAGNALTSVISTFLLPVKKAIAIDLKKRNGNYNKVKRFSYIEGDIYSPLMNLQLLDIDPIILIAVHACKNLSERVIELFNEYNQIKYLFLMPCCIDPSKIDQDISVKVGKSFAWIYYLKGLIKKKYHPRIKQDKFILSPKNYIISAKKEINYEPLEKNNY